MSAAEVIAQIEALPEAERFEVAEETLRHLAPAALKRMERKLFRLRHPEIPEEIVRGFEDCEDGNTVDMETALYETPPEHLR